MLKALQLLAVVCAIAVGIVWYALGAHLGWTQTNVPTTQVDPVTEIEYTEYSDGFVPGVDFLAAGLAGSVALFAVCVIFSKLQRKTNS